MRIGSIGNHPGAGAGAAEAKDAAEAKEVEIYPLCDPIPRNVTLKSTPYTKYCDSPR